MIKKIFSQINILTIDGWSMNENVYICNVEYDKL